MKHEVKPRGYRYSDKELKKIALCYTRRIDFCDGHRRAYDQSTKRKIMDKICKHMIICRHSVTLSDFKTSLKYCHSKTEMLYKYPHIYRKALKEGWLNNVRLKEIHSVVSAGELSLNSFLEKVFKLKFKKTNPKWLINDKTGYPMQLDGYNEKLKIAFEHQGQQHYDKKNRYFDKNLLVRDKLKVKLCQENKVRLIVVPEISHFFNFNEEKIKNFLLKQFENHRIKVPKSFHKTPFVLVVRYKNNPKTETDLLKMLGKYKDRSSFIKHQYRLYRYLIRTWAWDRISKKVWNIPKTIRIKWTHSLVRKAAKKYTRRFSFKKGNLKAYRAAIKMGILQKVCSHMPKHFQPKRAK